MSTHKNAIDTPSGSSSDQSDESSGGWTSFIHHWLDEARQLGTALTAGGDLSKCSLPEIIFGGCGPDDSTDSHSRQRRVDYPDGSSRNFSYKDKDLVAITEPNGDTLHLDSQNRWIGPDGKPSNIANPTVSADGTYSVFNNDKRELTIYNTDGSSSTVSEANLTGLNLYPDRGQKEAAEARYSDLEKNANLSPGFKTILSDLHTMGFSTYDTWQGSYASISGSGGDKGDVYQQWKNLPGAVARESSHDHIGQQYEIRTGVGDSAILFGIAPDGNTFFQLERHAGLLPDGAGPNPAHGNDYNLYRQIHQNIGPLGTSPFTDKDPIVLDAQPGSNSHTRIFLW